MKRFVLAAAFVAIGVAPAFAAPACYFAKGGALNLQLGIEIGEFTQRDRAEIYEQRLRQRGINAMQTRFWNGCIQTFVVENGKRSMRFYDPWSLEEIPY